jgi:RES domain
VVIALKPPRRPLPAGGATWTWNRRRSRRARWQWCRVYHAGGHTPAGDTPRTYGPLARFDPHRPDGAGVARVDPDGRSVLYVGVDLATSLCEVFGEAEEAQLCPQWRVAVLEPKLPLTVFDLCAPGAAMAIGALPSLGDGDLPRRLTQEWARAIYEDQPCPEPLTGIRYRSAYNGDLSLALWDSNRAVATASDGRGRAADLALTHPAMINYVTVACAPRRIAVTVINSTQCGRCVADP